MRNIFGGRTEDDGRVRRTNEKIKSLYKEASIICMVTAQRLRYLDKISIPEMAMRQTIGGKRKERSTTTTNCRIERENNG